MDAPLRAGIGHRLAQALASCVACQPESLRHHPDLTGVLHADRQQDWHDDAPAARTLAKLACTLHLDEAEHLACRLALQVEIDLGLGAALSLLQGNDQEPGPQRPTLGLLAALVHGGDDRMVHGHTMGCLLQGPAAACGLLQIAQAGPLARRTLALPAALTAMLLTGVVPASVTLGVLRLRTLVAPNGWIPTWIPTAWVEALATATLQAGAAQAIVLRGAETSELVAIAQMLAKRAGLCAVQIEGEGEELLPATVATQARREGLAPSLLVAGAAVVWCVPSGLGRPLRLPVVAGFDGPWIVLADADATVQADAAVQVREIELPRPCPADRVALWRERVGASRLQGTADIAAVGGSRCGLAVLRRAAQQSAVHGLAPAQALREAVYEAARELSAWARVSQDTVPIETWVGQETLQRDLDLLRVRCEARDDAACGLGPLLDGRLPAGVKALFVGASGTGKTLAAQWIADRLSRPLVRIDVGSVVSKYIGETEKNLGALLTRAEQIDAVLLFDEADSLFGARTDVRQANDRYANMQTNYLLQRLDTFHGLALLTSNSRARFDGAFMRRLDVTIEFPLPDAAQRHRLWALHLDSSPLTPTDPLRVLRERMAALADLPGGHIRNAVLTAAMLARQRPPPCASPTPDAPEPAVPVIGAADLVDALAIEYRKLGLRLPDALHLP